MQGDVIDYKEPPTISPLTLDDMQGLIVLLYASFRMDPPGINQLVWIMGRKQSLSKFCNFSHEFSSLASFIRLG